MPTDDKTYNAELLKYEQLKTLQWDSDLKFVMDDPRGRRVLYKFIFQLAAVESLSYNATGNNETNFREGRRDVGLLMMKELQDRLPEQYLAMLGEAIRAAADLQLKLKILKEKSDA